ncbi:MAG TPA: multiubiquitin domain-containing protein [Candidatus Sulfotelmatobacter sp.]|nr:multiubiquitin domain-containing protein [Candidatus Sulfotelmatobacter sp.]
MSQDHKEVSIIIDKKEHKSPDPTTGHALYDLGKVDAQKYDLFRETQGKGDDELIADTETPVNLKDGDHFFSLKKKLNPGSECH